MFKVEIHKNDFDVSVEVENIVHEPDVRQLIDDITEKFSKEDVNEKKLASE